jgi:phosphoglycolate phosphatase
MSDIRGILFDKDGTLFDFHATWSNWTAALLLDLTAGDSDRAETLGGIIGFDPVARRFEPDSIVIANTPEEIATALLPFLPGATPAGLVNRMNLLAAQAALTSAVPLPPLFDTLRGRGLKIGLATNDAEGPARTHLATSGLQDHFDFVAGFDSGFGGKPAPAMLLAFADLFGMDPGQVVMVGDSRHDLIAGRAAGMRTVGVLTGIAGSDDLSPLADAVLPDIGHLPDWLDRLALVDSAA